MKTSIHSLAAAATVAACLNFSNQSPAASVTLAIDSSLSSLTLSGVAFGLPYTAQAPGSILDALSGTLVADLTGNVFTFSGGSTISLAQNPAGPFTTAPNPIGLEAGNFGVTATGFVTGYGLAHINGVYQGLVFDITGGTAQNGVAPSSDFINLTAGTLDYGITLNGTPFQANSSSLVGKGGTNTTASLASFDGTVLTLPIQIASGVYANREEFYTGTIVARIVAVPEPASLTLVGAGLLGVAIRRFFRSPTSK